MVINENCQLKDGKNIYIIDSGVLILKKTNIHLDQYWLIQEEL